MTELQRQAKLCIDARHHLADLKNQVVAARQLVDLRRSECLAMVAAGDCSRWHTSRVEEAKGELSELEGFADQTQSLIDAAIAKCGKAWQVELEKAERMVSDSEANIRDARSAIDKAISDFSESLADPVGASSVVKDSKRQLSTLADDLESWKAIVALYKEAIG
jgi:hypothetical protein